ncbi:MAG TPA: succinyl-diaminopimelate desuccinylase [Baekduia sp.]|uniref:succinyl-diaminopimelate desuccinylase n=1 Tax=Baekduia sp. TaxID=2600305 RepID=UPI002CF365AA|nr:succinyl-diaminopimelate desuccinylase [Baekduia sp.]HMJ37533.1 succinyl-diaminopimelate desuccinylase [Baekduia sp.]
MPDDGLAERLAARVLELVDVPSESGSEAALAAHVLDVLAPAAGARDAGDTCVVAGATARGDRSLVLLAGHLDTVPAQGNFPGSRDGDWVHGLGAADMKAALGVMIELALAPPDATVDVGFVFFGREELPFGDSALTPLLQREPGLREADLVLVMEPTGNGLHAGCVGNINATWTFRGVAGHSARPWLADNAIHRAGRGIAALAEVEPVDHAFAGLTFREVVSAVTIHGGVARNVVPDACVVEVNMRYAPGTSAAEAEARLRALCEPFGEVRIDGNAPSGAVPDGNPLVARLIETGGLSVAPKQAWTPVAEFAAAGVDAVNFGPGDPQYAHRRDERVAVASLVDSYNTLVRFLCA